MYNEAIMEELRDWLGDLLINKRWNQVSAILSILSREEEKKNNNGE